MVGNASAGAIGLHTVSRMKSSLCRFQMDLTSGAEIPSDHNVKRNNVTQRSPLNQPSNGDSDTSAEADKPEQGSLELEILPQPDDFTCGPTCLHAVYRYLGDDIDLKTVVHEVPRLKNGGTLAVMLANHALRRDYRATIYTYNLQIFDPSWFNQPNVPLAAKLESQANEKHDSKLRAATPSYLEYLRLCGQICFVDLTTRLIRRHLTAGRPVLTGLSSTYLYRAAREFGPKDDEDDIRGTPTGHFVVLCGYNEAERTVRIADPLHTNPLGLGMMYSINIERVLCAILLGVLTYDANLLVIEPPAKRKRKPRATADRG